jgi:hypothetical protein
LRPCFGADGDGGNLSDVGAEGGAAATIDVLSFGTFVYRSISLFTA